MDEAYIQTQIEKLKSLCDDWIDEIPDRNVHSVWHYKCTNGWFQNWFGRLSILRRQGLLQNDLNERYHNFQRYYAQRQEKDMQEEQGFLVKQEDIEFGNKLISDVIDSLEEKLQPPKN